MHCQISLTCLLAKVVRRLSASLGAEVGRGQKRREQLSPSALQIAAKIATALRPVIPYQDAALTLEAQRTDPDNNAHHALARLDV